MKECADKLQALLQHRLPRTIQARVRDKEEAKEIAEVLTRVMANIDQLDTSGDGATKRGVARPTETFVIFYIERLMK